MPNADVDHIEGLGSEVLGKLQELVEAEAVGSGVAPVGIHVAWPALYRADGSLPMVSVLRFDVALHVAAAGEAHESRVKGLELLSQVDAAAVLAALEGRREEAHHVEEDAAGGLKLQVENGLRVALSSYDVGFHLLPRAPPTLFRGSNGEYSLAQHLAVLAFEGSTNSPSKGGWGCYPERQFVLRPCHHVDAPIALVADAATGFCDFYLQGVALLLAQQAFGYEADVGSLCLPMLRLLGVVLKGAVPDELGIEAAIAGEVDVLVEDAVERRTDFDAFLCYIDLDFHLCISLIGQACRSTKGQQDHDKNTPFHIRFLTFMVIDSSAKL